MADEEAADAYFLHNDQELERLALQHDLMKDAMGGLIEAPIDFTRGSVTVLDSATADGHWIRDLASSLPEDADVTFFGTDVNETYMPQKSSPNIIYQVQDILKPWPQEWEGKFDLVHQRLVLPVVGSAATEVVARLVGLVKPGGYIQLFETRCEVGKNDGPAVQEFRRVMEFVFRQAGYDPSFAQNDLRRCLDDLGLEDVHDHIVHVYLGAKNKHSQISKSSIISTSIGLEALVSIIKSLPALPEPLFGIDMETLTTRYIDELGERGAYFPMHVFWGRKPDQTRP